MPTRAGNANIDWHTSSLANAGGVKEREHVLRSWYKYLGSSMQPEGGCICASSFRYDTGGKEGRKQWSIN